MDFFSTFLQLSGVAALIALNGFFVAAEFAIVKIRLTQIEPLVRTGMRRARLAQHVVSRLDHYLSACQLGITMTGLGLGWIGEPFAAGLLTPVFNAVGFLSEGTRETLTFIIGFSVITYVVIVIGEQAPKWLAIRYPQRMTLLIVDPLHLFHRAFRPFIWLVNVSANAVLRMAGVELAGEGDVLHSEEELRLLLSKGKTITSTGKSISLRALQLRDRTVREVMVPRTQVVVMQTTKTIAQNVGTALETQFTRHPLCERNLDNVAGMIHLKDLFKLQGQDGPGSRLLDIKREILFVPETMSLERTLHLFLARRILMAIAVDEYGGTAGLVTLENVLEEIVGEIRDEFDVETFLVHRISDEEFLVDGAMPLLDFIRKFEIVPDTRDVVTVSGYVISLCGHVPDRGEELQMGVWTAVVEAVEGVQVKSIRMRRKADAAGGEQ